MFRQIRIASHVVTTALAAAIAVAFGVSFGSWKVWAIRGDLWVLAQLDGRADVSGIDSPDVLNSDIWRFGLVGVRYGRQVVSDNAQGYTPSLVHVVVVPLWIPFCAAAAWPAAGLSRWAIARRRSRHGRCVRCGYDRRASPVRCPECAVER